MRKTTTHWLAIGFMLLGLVGCKSNGTTTGEAEPTTTEPTGATAAEQSGTETSEPTEEAPMPAGTRQEMMMAVCPMDVSGTSVSMMSEGEMLGMNFETSKPDQVDELRNRVREMVQMHNTYHDASGDADVMNQRMHGEMMKGKMHGEMMKGKRMRMRMHADEQMHGFMMGTTAKYVETEKGARLDVEMATDADRDQMHEMLKNRVNRMGSGTCPYMMGMMGSSGSR